MRPGMLVLILGMALATYITRATMLVLGKRVDLPPLLLRSLRYVPIAILAAIIFPAVLAPQGPVDISPSNPYLLAAAVTVLVVRLTRNSAAGILAGLSLMLLLRLWIQ